MLTVMPSAPSSCDKVRVKASSAALAAVPSWHEHDRVLDQVGADVNDAAAARGAHAGQGGLVVL